MKSFETELRKLHSDNTVSFLDDLVNRAGVNIEENRKTVALYHTYCENLTKLKQKLFFLLFLRVLMVITIFLIPVVIFKTNPKIQALRDEIASADSKAAELLAEAHRQMAPLNELFTDRDSLELIHKTIPLLSFDHCFSAEKESDMKTNFDFVVENDNNESTLDVLSGEYNGNPFLFENKLVHSMGTQTYYGQKTISWTATERGSDGRPRVVTKTQTLHASVVKPKPLFNTQVVLHYGSLSGAELCFSRNAEHHERKSKRKLALHLKIGKWNLDGMAKDALKNNRQFTAMSNSDFEVLFDALDRNNEVQFRTLFTPLAQTNMVSLILSKVGFGDDFRFIKKNRMNKIISEHSQGRKMFLKPEEYASFSYDVIKSNFISKNETFFKSVYFDFAPLLAIPSYQERPVHSLKPIPDLSQLYSLKECESLANAVDEKEVVHPKTKTQAILKSSFVRSEDDVDETCITAFSYDIKQRVDIVPVHGNDGKIHDVSVPWEEFLPLEHQGNFFVAKHTDVQKTGVMASRNGLCIFK